MKVSIITPSFRNSDWLKLCIASVADQGGATVEHIIQDSCSDDGTQEWLIRDKRVKAFIEKDSGMYAAINQGYRRASGDVLAYLNCDEQYLPGAIKSVATHFENHPDTDILIADTIIVDEQGDFICCRKCQKPWPGFIWVHNPTITSSIFIHRRVIDHHGLFFDAQWRELGDIFWMIEAVKRRLKFATLKSYTSVFTDSGENLCLKPNAQQERRRKIELMPGWIRKLGWPMLQIHRLRQLASGGYHEASLSYSIYTRRNQHHRAEFQVGQPTCIWRGRHPVMNVPSR